MLLPDARASAASSIAADPDSLGAEEHYGTTEDVIAAPHYHGSGGKATATIGHPIRAIQSLSIEARLTCDLKPEAELPPGEVEFLPIGDANAYLQRPQGRTKFAFASTVRFRRQEQNQLVIINHFALRESSDLNGRPTTSLSNYDTLAVPIVTAVWGKYLNTMLLLEVSMTVDGEDMWYYSYRITQGATALKCFVPPPEYQLA